MYTLPLSHHAFALEAQTLFFGEESIRPRAGLGTLDALLTYLTVHCLQLRHNGVYRR